MFKPPGNSNPPSNVILATSLGRPNCIRVDMGNNDNITMGNVDIVDMGNRTSNNNKARTFNNNRIIRLLMLGIYIYSIIKIPE